MSNEKVNGENRPAARVPAPDPALPEAIPLRVHSILNTVTVGARHDARSGTHRSRAEPAHRKYGFSHSINPYRGCAFACRYCYARYTHEWLGLDGDSDFESKIHLKQDIARTLTHDLQRLKRRVAAGEEIGSIAIGTATDPYQPLEKEYGLTRACLEVFANDAGPAGIEGWSIEITTKSNLILRDLDLLRAIAERHTLVVHVTVTTLDRDLARLLEPGAPSPRARIEAIAALHAAGIRVEPFVSPLIPAINDDAHDLELLFHELATVGAERVICEAIFLRSPTREVFLRTLEQSFPDLADGYRRRFAESAFLSPIEVERLRGRVDRLRRRFGLVGSQRGEAAGGREPRRAGPRSLPRRQPPRAPVNGPEQLGLRF